MDYQKNIRVKNFLRLVKNHCKKCNVILVFSPSFEVNAEGSRCQGYFTPPDHTYGDPGRVQIAVKYRKTREWIYTLVHEYVHFLQWMRDDPIFLEEDYMELEKATEKEALELCKKYKLPIPRKILLKDHREYIKKLSEEGY